MSNLEFTDLVLLVGTNPLPNAVIADYFIGLNKKLEKIWLIHSGSRGTKKYAETIEEFIETRINSSNIEVNTTIIIDNIAKKKSIEDAFKSLFKKISNKIVHLNYTGGTKAMVVHSYRSVEQNQINEYSFSYLDSKEFKLYYENCDLEETDDLRNEVNITFEEMYKLHEFKSNDGDIIFEEANNKFEELLENDEIDNFYYEGNGGYTRKLFENTKGSLSKKIKDINPKKDEDPLNFKKFEANEIFNSINKLMVIDNSEATKDYRLFIDKQFNESISNSKKHNHFLKAVEYLDGKWLEQVVLARLSNLLDKDKYKSSISSNLKHDSWDDLDFEIDLVTIRGYQLIATSCTTSSDKSLCKSKGFEVIYRAKQIGGDEAKMILITMLEKDKQVKDLEKTLKYNTGGKDKIIVLGKDDLKKDKFNEKIKNFLED